MSTESESPQVSAGRALCRRAARSRWVVPVFAVVFGVAVFAIQAANRDRVGGLVSLGIVLGYALILVLTSRRSETASLLRGEVPDERAAWIQLQAGAATGYLLILVVVGGFVVSLARGSDMTQWWANLSAVGGVAYFVSLTWFHRRS